MVAAVVPPSVAVVALLLAGGLLYAVARRVRRPAREGASRVLLVVGLVIAPLLALATASTRMVADMKEVGACGSCHVMDHFVADLYDTASVTLAARHFRADSMPDGACYACHTGYGVSGSFVAKRDGLHHWWQYVTHTWTEPIEYQGRYPNANCLACHPEEPMFADSIPLHVALQDSIMADAVTCFMCHGEPHARRAVVNAAGTIE
jgi:cytochrome c nitrite reductase small subunit